MTPIDGESNGKMEIEVETGSIWGTWDFSFPKWGSYTKDYITLVSMLEFPSFGNLPYIERDNTRGSI